MQGSFFAVAAAVTASLYDACGNACTMTLNFVWLALKSLTIWLTTPSSSGFPALWVHSVMSPPALLPPLELSLTVPQPATISSPAVKAATAWGVRRRNGRISMVNLGFRVARRPARHQPAVRAEGWMSGQAPLDGGATESRRCSVPRILACCG